MLRPQLSRTSGARLSPSPAGSFGAVRPLAARSDVDMHDAITVSANSADTRRGACGGEDGGLAHSWNPDVRGLAVAMHRSAPAVRTAPRCQHGPRSSSFPDMTEYGEELRRQAVVLHILGLYAVVVGARPAAVRKVEGGRPGRGLFGGHAAAQGDRCHRHAGVSSHVGPFQGFLQGKGEVSCTVRSLPDLVS